MNLLLGHVCFFLLIIIFPPFILLSSKITGLEFSHTLNPHFCIISSTVIPFKSKLSILFQYLYASICVLKQNIFQVTPIYIYTHTQGILLFLFLVNIYTRCTFSCGRHPLIQTSLWAWAVSYQLLFCHMGIFTQSVGSRVWIFRFGPFGDPQKNET